MGLQDRIDRIIAKTRRLLEKETVPERRRELEDVLRRAESASRMNQLPTPSRWQKRHR